MPTDTPKYANNLLEAASECVSKDMPFTATAITHLTLLTETVNAMNANFSQTVNAMNATFSQTVKAMNAKHTDLSKTVEYSNEELTATKETLDRMDKTLSHTSRLSRMAMLKAVEAELKSERLAYLDVLLRAKRKHTGSGTAGFVMDMAHASLLIASVVASGGAGLGLAVGASVVKGARNNANVMDAALTASSIAEGKKSNIDMRNAQNLGDVKSAATTSDHAKLDTAVRAEVDAGWLVANRIKGFKEDMERLQNWYDFKKQSPSIGIGSYQLTEVKRKTTAWIHHGEGGTFAIEHDFCIALGLAYVEFLRELERGGLEKLLEDAEQQQSLAGPHLITKHILSQACDLYSKALDNKNAAYAGLMQNRGDPRFYGYSGGEALSAVTEAASVLERETSNGQDLSEVQGKVERELNL